MGLTSKSQEVLDARRIAAFKKSLAQVFFFLYRQKFVMWDPQFREIVAKSVGGDSPRQIGYRQASSLKGGCR